LRDRIKNKRGDEQKKNGGFLHFVPGLFSRNFAPVQEPANSFANFKMSESSCSLVEKKHPVFPVRKNIG
jgi:hypothetical protein